MVFRASSGSIGKTWSPVMGKLVGGAMVAIDMMPPYLMLWIKMDFKAQKETKVITYQPVQTSASCAAEPQP